MHTNLNQLGTVHVLSALGRHRPGCSMRHTLLLSLCIACTAWVASAEPRVQQLPSSLLLPPEPVPPDAPILSGLMQHDPALLGLKPRAVLGYVSDKGWALLEFLAMMHASWRHLMADPATGGVQLDIFAFTHPAWADVLSNVCTVLDLDEVFRRRPSPTCYVIIYPVPPQHIWHGYPYINNVHFFADGRVASILTSHYGYVMKSDFDTYLTPALLRHTPSRLLFGIQEYGVLPETRARLVRVADDLGFRHKGRHNLGPTWLGDAATIIDMANRTIPVLHHIITREFEQLPEGGIKQQWLKGEGFPLWSAGMAAMYATELIANHFIEHFDSTLLMDMHADSSLSVDEVRVGILRAKVLKGIML